MCEIKAFDSAIVSNYCPVVYSPKELIPCNEIVAQLFSLQISSSQMRKGKQAKLFVTSFRNELYLPLYEGEPAFVL